MNSSDISKMRYEAIKRANDAKRKSKIPQEINTEQDKVINSEKTEDQKENKLNNATTTGSVIQTLYNDPEQLMLIVLIMILADEKANIELIIALLYLII